MNSSFKKILQYCSHRIHMPSLRKPECMPFKNRISFHFGRWPAEHAGTAVIFFPWSAATLNCGLAGLIAVHRQRPPAPLDSLDELAGLIQDIEAKPLCTESLKETAAQGDRNNNAETIEQLYRATRELQRQDHFVALYQKQPYQDRLAQLFRQLEAVIARDAHILQDQMGQLPTAAVEAADQKIVKLKDAAWCLKTEILDNIDKTRDLIPLTPDQPERTEIKIYRNLNAVLNSIDRLEVRGRDSAGISLLFILDHSAWKQFESGLASQDLTREFNQRKQQPVLGNGSISMEPGADSDWTGITLTYKVAAEIGSLGDNVRQLRTQICADAILHLISRLPHRFHTISAHTRWASVGAISIANCHPVDNATSGPAKNRRGIIHACLNGDIDNYLELKAEWEASGERIPEDITTDTKIIPLQVEKYLCLGHPVKDAFRLAVNDFEGSHAIAMHTDLAPGKFFLAQRGSGQAVFVGIADDHYMPTSEVYGFIEETSRYIKMDGEKIVNGPHGPTQGQLFVLDQDSAGGMDGIVACHYDGTPIQFDENSIQHTEITSRDIDRQDFSHYFLKEISEAPLSVSKTIQNRWKVDKNDPGRYTIALDEKSFPKKIADALTQNQIQRIYFIGQGTAGVAALANADILNYYLNEPLLQISALKASELSGFRLGGHDTSSAMRDTLVIAISQSGTTTDTNRTVDMVRARGAYTMAIVNRRDSDITFKVDGVVYTSSGRDIEMSVASTKAFYSQIVAGALVSLKIAQIKGRRSGQFITDEIKSLLRLPAQMKTVLDLGDQISRSARRLAPLKTYWAAVGSGSNKAAADEIRIKLSELCYKTISSDYVEDKKHIDLSSEPLIIICAAGTPETVIGDIIKDTAIFKAHKATPVVIADEGEIRFASYAEDIFYVPAVASHLAPILNTLAGHLWGYHAALGINSGSRFLYEFREEINKTINRFADDGLDVYEVVLEKTFREKIAQFYQQFRRRQASGELPTTISHTADLLLLLKYLSGTPAGVGF